MCLNRTFIFFCPSAESNFQYIVRWCALTMCQSTEDEEKYQLGRKKTRKIVFLYVGFVISYIFVVLGLAKYLLIWFGKAIDATATLINGSTYG